jgi:gamma-polyglutamate synthase
MAALAAAAAVLLGLLVAERIRLDRRRAAIPLRIAVTGTRGKSTVTRMLASVLRADGRSVVAKTTGSEPVVIMPDGAERAVRRRGPPSIIEQKHVLHLAARLRADAVVIEVMSIHPDNHRVECRKLLQPHVVIATNFRVDHTASLGVTRGSVAEVLSLDVPPGAQVLVPTAECEPEFRRGVAAVGASLIEVTGESEAEGARSPDNGRWHADEALVRAAAALLGVDAMAVRRGLGAARYDIGSLQAWRAAADGPGGGCLLVNAFAANDPESTAHAYDKVLTAFGTSSTRCVGLLNLRADRADRTLQWLDALAGGMIHRFGHLFICGDHAHATRRRLRRAGTAVEVDIVRGRDPRGITDSVLRIAGADDIVFGFGNIGGRGAALVRHWSAVATPVGG